MICKVKDQAQLMGILQILIVWKMCLVWLICIAVPHDVGESS